MTARSQISPFLFFLFHDALQRRHLEFIVWNSETIKCIQGRVVCRGDRKGAALTLDPKRSVTGGQMMAIPRSSRRLRPVMECSYLSDDLFPFHTWGSLRNPGSSQSYVWKTPRKDFHKVPFFFFFKINVMTKPFIGCHLKICKCHSIMKFVCLLYCC